MDAERCAYIAETLGVTSETPQDATWFLHGKRIAQTIREEAYREGLGRSRNFPATLQKEYENYRRRNTLTADENKIVAHARKRTSDALLVSALLIIIGRLTHEERR